MKSNSRTPRVATGLVLVVALTVAQAAPALGAQIPDPSSSLFLQTSGPNAGITIGDYYTSPSGGNTDHLFILMVPSSWPAGTPVTVSLYDPELAEPDPVSPAANDEIRGGADSATFTLESPSGATITSATYADAATNGMWVELATFDPGATGTGTYELHVTVSDNDDNSWRVNASHDPDCVVGVPCDSASLQDGDEVDSVGGSGSLGLGVVRTSYQHAGSGLVCQDHVFYIDSSTSNPVAHNFDMDNNGSVTYTAPNGTTIAGTVSGNGVWNGSSDTTRIGDALPEIYGWWTAKICISVNNQYVFEAPDANPSFSQPQPTPRLEITKDDGTDTVAVGDQVAYTITVDNVSDEDSLPGDAHGIEITDTLPAGATFVDCTGPSGLTCTESGGAVTAIYSPLLAPGDNFDFTLTVIVGAAADDPMVNTASVSYDDHLGNAFTPVQGSDSDDVEFAPVLSLTAIGTNQSLRGDTANVTFELSHAGSSDASTVSSPAVSCDICDTLALASGDADSDGVLDAGETWTYEGSIATGSGDPDPLIATGSASGTDRDGDSVSTGATHSIDIVEPGSIAGTVFEDVDGDGLFDFGEPIIDGAMATLSDSSGLVATDAGPGGHSFSDLWPADYTVSVDESSVPSGLFLTSSNPLGVPLAEGEAATGVDFGFALPVTITGTVFVDANFDGSYDIAGEAGHEGATMALTDSSGTVVTSTLSASDGSYSFDVMPGDYTVAMTDGLPPGWAFTTDESIVLGVVTSGTSSSGHIFGVANRPPVTDDVTETVRVGDAPAPLTATDPEGAGVEFSILSGALPAGLELVSDGSWTGGAQESGIFAVTLEVCDLASPNACSQMALELTVPALEIQDSQAVLPFTGIDTDSLLALGLLLVGSGGLLVFAVRESPETTPAV